MPQHLPFPDECLHRSHYFILQNFHPQLASKTFHSFTRSSNLLSVCGSPICLTSSHFDVFIPPLPRNVVTSPQHLFVDTSIYLFPRSVRHKPHQRIKRFHCRYVRNYHSTTRSPSKSPSSTYSRTTTQHDIPSTTKIRSPIQTETKEEEDDQYPQCPQHP